jgi:hypothetical protein
MLSRDDDEISAAHTKYRHTRRVKRLSVHFSIDRQNEELAERVYVHVFRFQNTFGEIQARPGIVVVIGQNIIRGHHGTQKRRRREAE